MDERELRHILANLLGYRIPDRHTILSIILLSIEKHQNLENTIIIDISNPNHHLYIIGDLHGEFEDLIEIFKIIDDEDPTSPKQLLFLGDIVDRGLRSVETLLTILIMMLLWPNRVFLLRGNHETEAISRFYGFYDECIRKNLRSCYCHFLQLFQTLPIGCIIRYNIPSCEQCIETINIPTSENAEQEESTRCHTYFYEKFYIQSVNSYEEPPGIQPIVKVSLSPAIEHVVQPRDIIPKYEIFEAIKFRHLEEDACLRLSSGTAIGSISSSLIDESIMQANMDEPSTSTTSTVYPIDGSEKLIRNVFACHGGISQYLTDITELDLECRAFNDFSEDENQRIIADILWSDPDEGIDGYGASQRRMGHTFGYRAVQRFLEENDLDIIVRGHELAPNGYKKELGDRVITVCSAANYDQRCANRGTILLFQSGILYKREFCKQYADGDKRPTMKIDYFL